MRRVVSALWALALAAWAMPAPASSQIPQRRAGEPVADYLARAEADGFAGVVLLAIGDSVIVHRGLGIANAATKARFETSTLSYIGSLTKQFTAACILMLADSGKLSVRDTLAQFFNDVPADKAGITIHQLLTHTSGIPDSVGERHGSVFVSRDEFVDRVFAAPLDAGPRQWSYSNPGYVLLAAIVEKLSGDSYERFVRDRLFRHAGPLASTGYTFATDRALHVAHGTRNGTDLGAPFDRRSWHADGPTWALRGAGGMLSTAADLFTWFRALDSGKILGKESLAAMFAPMVAEDSSNTAFYGYGWSVMPKTKRGRVVGHNGSDGTFYATEVYFADTRVLVIVLTNEQRSGFRNVEAGLIAAAHEIVGLSFRSPDAIDLLQKDDLMPCELAQRACFR